VTPAGALHAHAVVHVRPEAIKARVEDADALDDLPPEEQGVAHQCGPAGDLSGELPAYVGGETGGVVEAVDRLGRG
jgi:hypothetical protein